MHKAIEASWSTRLTGALLAVGVAAAHIADQGGLTAFNDSADWIGWGYRLTEIGGAATALVLLVAGSRFLAWLPPLLLGAGPAIFFVLSRTTGIPGDSADKNNWMWDVGALSLIIEVALVAISVGVLATRHSSRVRGTRQARVDGAVSDSTESARQVVAQAR